MKTKAELGQENADLKIEINKAHQALTELKAYLLSPKFYEDTTVQTADVLRRLEGVTQMISFVRFDSLSGFLQDDA